MNVKTFKRIYRTAIVSLLIFSFWAWPVYCQVIIGAGNGDHDQLPHTPIGGISIIAALGFGYGLKKLYDRNKG